MSTITGGNAPSGGPGRVHNYNAERAPGATDDIASGYLPASFWAWPAAERVWVCIDGSEGAAQWAELAISSQISDGTNTVTAEQARNHIDDTANPHGVTAAQAGADPAGSAAAAQTAVQANLDTHEANVSNPHGVTRAQIGAAADADLTAHTGNTSNPHSVTAAQAGADPSGTAAAVQTNLDTHEANVANPHSVTATQVGAAGILSELKTVDGSGSGLDADLLKGRNIFTGSFSQGAGNVIPGWVTHTVTIAGASVGDFVLVALPTSWDAQWTCHGFVSASDTVKVYVTNMSGSSAEIPPGTYNVTVLTK